MRYTTSIQKLATLQGEKQQQQAGCCLPHRPRGLLLLLFPHAELDVVVTPEGGEAGEERARPRVDRARLLRRRKEGRWDEEREGGRARERARAAVWIMRPKREQQPRTAFSLSSPLFCSSGCSLCRRGAEEEIDRERGGKEEGRGGGRPFLLVNLRVTTLRRPRRLQLIWEVPRIFIVRIMVVKLSTQHSSIYILRYR